MDSSIILGRSWCALVALVALRASTAGAATIHVPFDRPNIKSAISSAHDGDVVLVADGVYTGGGNRNLDFHGKAITVRSQNGAANCIIDCQELGRAFRFHRGEADASVLDGFTIRNGVADKGGAILCEASSPTILNCTFLQNTSTGTRSGDGGGAVFSKDSSPSLSYCTFVANAVIGPDHQGGGGIACVGSGSPLIADCTFSGNMANDAEFGGGGGALIALASNATLTGCTFTGNSGRFGGALQFVGASPTVTACTIIGNLAVQSGGGVIVTDLDGFPSDATFTRCSFQGNSSTGGQGGALFVTGQVSGPATAAVTVHDSVMSGNSGTGDGGAVANEGGTLLMKNCTLVGNVLAFGPSSPTCDTAGAGLCAWNGGVSMILNCVLQANTAVCGPQLALYGDMGGGCKGATLLMVEFSAVEGGEDQVYVDPQTGGNSIVSWGVGNTPADAVFVRIPSLGPDGLPGTADDDYGDLHLLPGSPCIDAGDPAYMRKPDEIDIDGDPRVLDGDGDGIAVIDIGADEFSPQ